MTANLVFLNKDSLFKSDASSPNVAKPRGESEALYYGTKQHPEGSKIFSGQVADSIIASTKAAEVLTAVSALSENSDALNQANVFNYQSLKNNSDYFSAPTFGWNWGSLHEYNAVDIANRCGSPVYAAAEGLVIPEDSKSSDGYGIFILIEHPNGTKTRYAHLEKTAIAVGRYVNKGDLIGYVGNTGDAHGPSGCHLHFEVYGAENPFSLTRY